MKLYPLKKYLRQNKPGKNGKAGTFNLRLLFSFKAEYKPLRVEIGLGTNNELEAIQRALIFLKGIYALGGCFSNKIAVESIKGSKFSILDAIDYGKKQQKAEKKKQEKLCDLPLFRFSAQFLPPFQNVEKTKENG